MDNKIEKWQRWLGEIEQKVGITYEIAKLSHKRGMYNEFLKIIHENPKLNEPNYFYQFISSNYIHSLLLAIRRQTKPQKDSISLIDLIKDIKKNASLITKEFYLGLFENPDDWNEKDFARLYAGDIGDHLDPDIMGQELNRIEKITQKTESFTDRRLAHYDKREPTYIPSVDELHECCDLLEKSHRTIFQLLRGSDIIIEPKITPTWKSIFRFAWLQN